MVKFDADGVGAGVAELVEDGQGLLPGVVGGLGGLLEPELGRLVLSDEQTSSRGARDR